jgi:hypothetical protein
MVQSIFGWLRVRENLFFVLLIFLHLIPIWAVHYFPSIDGPSHIYHASVLREYNLPERSAFREYYSLNINPVPNWFSHLVLNCFLRKTRTDLFHRTCNFVGYYCVIRS